MESPVNFTLEEFFGDALSVRRKKNRTGNLLDRASRVARGAPEVMVKITGFGKSVSHIRSHLDYISRKGKISLETNAEENLDSRESVGWFVDSWQEQWAKETQSNNRRQMLHLVLSRPSHVDQESVRQASRSFAKEVFAEHEYALALHTDGGNPHCHLIVRMTDRHGKRVNPRKADLQHWREVFAEKVREQGYEAEATSRRTRGITRKSEKSLIRHIESEKKEDKQRLSKVKALRVQDALNDIADIIPSDLRPWEKPIQEKQR
jgi:NCAIR mutase (PurE)-related protein